MQGSTTPIGQRPGEGFHCIGNRGLISQARQRRQWKEIAQGVECAKGAKRKASNASTAAQASVKKTSNASKALNAPMASIVGTRQMCKRRHMRQMRQLRQMAILWRGCVTCGKRGDHAQCLRGRPLPKRFWVGPGVSWAGLGGARLGHRGPNVL